MKRVMAYIITYPPGGAVYIEYLLEGDTNYGAPVQYSASVGAIIVEMLNSRNVFMFPNGTLKASQHYEVESSKVQA